MYKGIVASKQYTKVKGIALVINDENYDNNKMINGYILVKERTKPADLVIMKNSLGIITELGGILSHAAIVSREFKIPCIVGVKEILSKIETGDEIEMNMKTGEIKITQTKNRCLYVLSKSKI